MTKTVIESLLEVSDQSGYALIDSVEEIEHKDLRAEEVEAEECKEVEAEECKEVETEECKEVETESEEAEASVITPGIRALIRVDIKTHLCKLCIDELKACDNVTYVYGNGEGSYKGLPNIAACDSFDAKFVGRRSADRREVLQKRDELKPKTIPIPVEWE